MIQKIQIEWNSNNGWINDGLLYFGQRIVEMLDYMTTDLYRAPLQNTNRLIDEYIDIYSTNNNPNQLQLVKDELLYFFENDVVLKYKYKPQKLGQLISLIKNQKEPIDAFRYMQKTIGRKYLAWCKEYIKYVVPQSKLKGKIESAICCFIPELLRYGYSRDEVYHNAREILLSSHTNPETALDTFLNIYNLEKKEYTVYILFSNQITQFQDILTKHINIDFTPDKREELINPDKQYVTAKKSNVKALDASHAANYAMQTIELFLDFYQFLGNYNDSLAQQTVWVYDSQNSCRKLRVNRERYKSIEDNSQSRVGELSEKIINQLVAGAKCSLDQLIKILKIHNRAISNNGLENGFLNMWSILEMICVSDMQGKKADQVIKELIPILQKDYLVEVFHDIERNLKQVLTNKEYDELLSVVDEQASTPSSKIAMLLLLEKYGTNVDDFVDQLVNYPVLRSRILNIRDDCHKMSNLYRMSEEYAQRVSWHISRIYRARNAIIHSGKTVKDIKDLGEHLHEYIDQIVLEIVVQLSRGSLCDISNVLIDSRLAREELFAELSNEAFFTEREVNMLFDHELFYTP